MRSARLIVVVLIVAHLGILLYAQSTKVELSGIIRDPSSLPIAGAEVRLRNVNTESEQSASTGREGAYHFFALQPGTYTISVTKDGFAGLRRDGVVLRADVWARKILPDPHNPRVGPKRRHPFAIEPGTGDEATRFAPVPDPTMI